jgi:uncharacterized protein (DUF4415 family)
MAKLPEPDLTDPDNPEWTAEDFARAKGPESMSYEMLTAFPNTLDRLERERRRGPGKKPRKVSQTLRIDPDVLAYFRGCGAGWQSRINAVLREAMERGR